jgi:arylsulfatase A-like enzyme
MVYIRLNLIWYMMRVGTIVRQGRDAIRGIGVSPMTAVASILACVTLAAAEAQHPNIIIVFVDDQGYADIGLHGADPDVRTPHLDQLARDGVLFTNGYATAPQCIPSRAGLMAGRHQNAFGLDDNMGGPLTHDEYTVAERLRDAGYVTGMVGKWHLEVGFDQENRPYYSREHQPDRHGFEEIFTGYMDRYLANFDLDGNDIEDGPETVVDRHYRVDIQTRAALAFLERRTEDERPFFLYLCYYAPHSPMEDPPHYMERMEHVEEYERRMGLASVLAMDEGVGLVREKLAEMGETENTLIFYISDNGAPLREGAYIGALNGPMVGEKGMQTNGGQRVPFIAAWPGAIPAGQIFQETIWTLDAVATGLAVAGAPVDDRIEGVNLLPWLTGEREGPVHEALHWRWRSQAAILSGHWKLILLGNERRYLFDMREIGKQTAEDNKIEENPEIAARLERELRVKADTWATPGLPKTVVAPDRMFYDLHVDRTLPPPPLGEGRVGVYHPWDETRPTTPLRSGSAK